MKPGAAVSCASCGATARVWTTGAQHVDGWPVLVTWQTPGGERTMVEETGAAARQLTCRACGASDPKAVVVHPRGAGEGPFRVEPGDRGGSSSSVQKAPLERPADPELKRAAENVRAVTSQLSLP